MAYLRVHPSVPFSSFQLLPFNPKGFLSTPSFWILSFLFPYSPEWKAFQSKKAPFQTIGSNRGEKERLTYERRSVRRGARFRRRKKMRASTKVHNNVEGRRSRRKKMAQAARRRLVVEARNKRAVMYDEGNQYVLLEPGQDERFVTKEELRDVLYHVLDSWEGQLPADLDSMDSLEDCVDYLVDNVCEINLNQDLGALQWYSIRLDS